MEPLEHEMRLKKASTKDAGQGDLRLRERERHVKFPKIGRIGHCIGKPH